MTPIDRQPQTATSDSALPVPARALAVPARGTLPQGPRQLVARRRELMRSAPQWESVWRGVAMQAIAPRDLVFTVSPTLSGDVSVLPEERPLPRHLGRSLAPFSAPPAHPRLLPNEPARKLASDAERLSTAAAAPRLATASLGWQGRPIDPPRQFERVAPAPPIAPAAPRDHRAPGGNLSTLLAGSANSFAPSAMGDVSRAQATRGPLIEPPAPRAEPRSWVQLNEPASAWGAASSSSQPTYPPPLASFDGPKAASPPPQRLPAATFFTSGGESTPAAPSRRFDAVKSTTRTPPPAAQTMASTAPPAASELSLVPSRSSGAVGERLGARLCELIEASQEELAASFEQRVARGWQTLRQQRDARLALWHSLE